jgi:hypothetical protein
MSLVPTWGQQSPLLFNQPKRTGKDLDARLEAYAKKRIRQQGLTDVTGWEVAFQKGFKSYNVLFKGPSKAFFVVRGISTNKGGWPSSDCGVGFFGTTPTIH